MLEDINKTHTWQKKNKRYKKDLNITCRDENLWNKQIKWLRLPAYYMMQKKGLLPEETVTEIIQNEA